MVAVEDSRRKSRPSLVPQLVAGELGRFRCAVWENVTLLIWTDQATLDAVKKVQRVTDRMLKRFPDGHSNVSFVTRGVPPPTPEARVALADSFNDQVSQIKCLTTVIEGEGFWASTLRSAITNMKMTAGRDMVMRLLSSIEEVVAWLPKEHAKRTGIDLDPKRFEAALRAFRSSR